jgi:hypothetical protein
MGPQDPGKIEVPVKSKDNVAASVAAAILCHAIEGVSCSDGKRAVHM